MDTEEEEYLIGTFYSKFFENLEYSASFRFILAFIVCIIFTLIYLFFIPLFQKKGMPKKRRDDINSKFISYFHAVVVVVISFYVYLSTPEFYDDLNIFYVSHGITIAAIISHGYFLYDSLCVILPNAIEYLPFVPHHLVGFFSISRYIFSMFAEGTTPFINNIYFMKEYGWRNSIWFKINALIILFSWGYFRFYYGAFWYCYAIFTKENQETWKEKPFWIYVYWLIQLFVFISLNVFWYFKIVNGFVKVIRGKKTALDKQYEQKDD